MKIDRNKLKKSTTDVPPDCRPLIERLKSATEETLPTELSVLKTWTYGKCELYHWADVLDRFDEVLEKGCKKETDKSWTLACDLPGNTGLKELLLQVLHFTSVLIEHSFSRHLYNSMEHLTCILSSCDMTIVLEVLNLLFVFSKRSNFISRLGNDKKQGLIRRLTHLAESWGGKDNGFGLAECCQDLPVSIFPSSSTTLHFEFYVENHDDKVSRKGAANFLTCIHMENLDQSTKLASEIMEELVAKFKIPPEKQTLLYTHIRLAKLFSRHESRTQCVQARLQSIAILVYCNAIQENISSLLYPGFIEELVDIVELADPDQKLVEIKGAALRTLTSIIHLERNPKLNNIIDATGAASYHGFLPVLVRNCIQHMTDAELKPFPLPYSTALFSFLYHLASYENGVEALVSCGMMESLLQVINWYGEGQDHITFATRAVRVVDLITNLDMAAFQSQGGLNAFINRLEHEVGICKVEQPFEIRLSRLDSSMDSQPESPPLAMETDTAASPEGPVKDGEGGAKEGEAGASTTPATEPTPSTSAADGNNLQPLPNYSAAKTGRQCFPQRAALLKSMLNFLKKAIPDPSFSDSMRHLMEGSLPKSLKHVISNAEYYGPSLFLLATDVVTVYVFQEPSLLSSLQDNGLTNVVLHALLIKDVPATREVLASLPNVFSALCLNARGLEAFVLCRPFDRLFKVLLSPDYLPAMRRRRSADPFGDTASNLGNAMDELMRHQPSLRTDATKAIIKLLQEVCGMGRDKKYICQKAQPKSEQLMMSLRSPQPADGGSSDEDDEEEDITTETPTESQDSESKTSLQPDTAQSTQSETPADKQAIPLMDYVLNGMKFVEAILSNNSTDDHCKEFVTQAGLKPLMGILGLPNLPIDFPTSPACQAVASVCKAILTLSREPHVLKEGLEHLNEVLQGLAPLHQPLEAPGGSVLLRELANVAHIPDATLSPTATPLLHTLASAHAYIMMFVHVCRMGQTDIRTISVSHWGSELGLQVLEGLSKLYTSLVWESTVLLALCSEDILPLGSDFGKCDMDKLLPRDFKHDRDAPREEEAGLTRAAGELGSNGVSHAMESLSTSDTPVHMDVEQPVAATDKDGKKSKLSPALQAQVKQLKPLLSVSSRLGRALAELFGLLVKLSVGTRVRQRGVQMIPTVPITPTPAAQAVAKALTKLLADGLQWQPPAYSPVPKLRLTFLVCSVGFTSPMLFDDKKQPYHLMLQKFVASGGQEALFQAFSWALSIDGKVPLTDGLEDPQLPGGTGEFLDAWLMLIEKMVNPRAVLDSPHYLLQHSTQPDFVPFKPTQYIISTQKAAFNAVMNLWTKKPLKVYGGRMSESILAILCHIIKGEGIIRENLAKEKGDTNASSSAAGPTAGPSTAAVPGIGTAAAPTAAVPGRPPINYAHVQQTAVMPMFANSADPDAVVTAWNGVAWQAQVMFMLVQELMEMGFSLTRCVEALRLTNSLEEATDHLLTTGDTGQPPIAGLDMDLSEEAQMMQAIAMSLGQNMETQDESEEKVAASEKKKVEEEEKEKQNSEEPLDKSVLDDFTANLFPGCLALMDTLPETVYRVCELLTVVTARNGIAWQTQVLSMLVQEVQSLAKSILSINTLTQWSEPAAQNKASQFATRIHLFSLLFEETMIPCAEALDTNSLADLLVQVMAACKDYLVAVEQAPTPKWLGPLLLLLDLYEKVSVISKRRISAEKTLANCHTWKWFDDTSGRWCKYNVGNNKTIDDAYQAGETSVRFTAGRRRYTVHFSSMVQVNEETSNRRPIMLCYAQAGDDKPQNKESNTAPPQPSPAPDTKMETDPAVPSTSDSSKDHVIVSGLNSEHVSSIIRSIVGLIGVPVEAETLHAALRLVLRLTRQHQYALLFAELGGPTLLLNLTQASAFQGFLSLTMLIFRHILDEPASLKYCMEKVIKGTCSGSGSSLTGVSQRSVGAKEMHYVLRVLGPAACREPALFAELAMDIMRIALPPPSKREDDESRLTGPNAPQILKCVPTKLMAITAVHSPLKEVVESLLNALVVKYAWKADEGSGGSADGKPQTLAEAIAEVVSELTDRQTEMMRQNSTAEIPAVEDDAAATNVQASAGTSSSKDTTKDKDIKSAEDARKQRPLLPKSAILRLLSEIIKSYCSCTQLITQHVYQAGQSELITEDCSVLAFVLDYLLHANSNAGDRDCPALSRVFVASIASCNHSPDAQMTLVSEVKAALQRALALPESSEKHSHVQSLTGIISTVIESCPTPGQIPNQVFKGQQHIMNNIVKNLLKRGVVTDLARIPYSLDLSSPYMANTINSSLKPLETLSRSVNQPVQSVTAKPKPKSDNDLAVENVESNVTEPAGEDVSVVLAEEGEINLDEVHIEDISDTTGDLAHLEEVHHLEGEEPPAMVASDLDQVLEHLLQHCDTDDREIQVLDELIMETEASDARAGEDEAADLIVDVEIEEGEIDDTHDSQMISQLISEGEDDDIDHTPNIAAHVDDEDTADSASDADDDDNDDGEDDDDDDQDDDEDNEDEDDEGSDMEGDNEDMQDVDDNFDDLFGRPFNNDTFVIHADEMFQPGANQHVVFNALDNGTVRTYQMPLSVPISDSDSGPDSTVPNVPPAPSTVSATHPLLVRQPDTANLMGITRVQRGRPRGTCRFNPSTQTLQVNFPRQPNPPVILQRLLGPTTASDVLQLTNSLSTQAGPPHTRVVLSNNDMRIVSRPDNDILEELFQDTYNDGPSLGMGALSAVPTTLSRWSEEAKVLDGDSIHDCMAAMKPQIVELLEKYRDEELAERREKRRKTAEDEAAKKTQDNKSQLPTSTEQHMEVSPNAPTSQALNMSTTDPLIVGNIPLPSTTVASTAADATPLAGRQISASEAAAAAEVIAEQMVEEVLSAPGLPAPPQYADLLATTNGAFRAMPPLTQPPPPPPDIVPSAASRLQSFSDITGQVPVPLTMEIPQQATPTPAVATTVPPITSLASALSMLNTPLTGPVRIASPFAGLDVSQIQMPPMSQVPQSEPRMPPPFSTLGSMPPPMPPLPFNTVPPMASYSQDTSLPMATPMVASTAAPIVAEYTPDNPIPMVAPMAPRLIRNTATGLPEFMPNMSSLASLLLSADADSDGPVRSFLWNMRASETTVPGGERVNLVDPALTTSSELSTGGAVRSGTESGVITPEEVSNITSSDAATVHSSGSGSPQEISAGSLLSNLASVTENAAPLSTRASSFRVSATTSSTSRVDPRHSISSSSGTPAAESSVPDGLDPSFLAALPENIRQEVIADHMRMQRIQQRTREQQSTESPGTMEVNQEFLAALPPAIQEEVLAQQRIEQERLAAQTSVQANPETPVDPASFFATLPSTLRQSVLADMDDSMVAVLPADLAAEAQGLRRELEERHRRLMQERLFTQQGSGSLSAILRHAGSLRYTLGRGPGSGAGRWRFGAGTRENAGFGSTNVKVRGRHLLDHEALTCLLVLLFVDEPKLNSGRLHRVMRNLCYHAPTRAWVVRSLLSILNRTSDTGKEKMCEADDRDKTRTPEKSKSRRGQPMQTDTASSSTSSKSEARTQGSWLSISLEAALGNRANVFQIQRTGGKKHLSTGHTHVNIHPQASPVVCRHVLDALISLAKIFPQQFLPTKAKEVQTCDSEVKEKDVDKTKAQPVTADGTASPRGKALERRDSRSEQRDTDFWELLIRLDSMCSSKKGKGIQRTHSNFSENDLGFKDYDSSPLGQLMAMLSHPVIKRSQLLTDRLLRLLGLVSTGLSDAARTQNPISTADNIAITLNRGTPTVAVSRIAVPTGQSVLIPSGPVLASVTPAAPPSSVTSTGVNTAVCTPDEGTSVDPPPLDKYTGEKKEPEVKPEEEEDVAILETQLSMAVQVLTSKSCSEEGLEDATNLLLQLSWANNATRSAVLQLLLSGAQTLGITVSQHIRSLLGELQAFSNNKRSPDAAQDEDKSMEAASTSQGDKGLLHDRFSGGSVIVTAPKKVKGGRELQLPSMTLLTSKVSSQQFFLRILKVIIQLRDAARNAKKKNKPGSLGLTTTGSRDFRRRHIGEAMAMLEAEADAIMQLVTRHDNERNADNTGQENEAANPPDTPDLPPAVPAVQPAVDQGEGAASSTGTTPGPASQESPMETDKAGTSVDEPTGEEEVQLPRLSDQLALEELWQVLGDCLSELDKTPDHHAVLILQPAVEAFFMVHAGEKEKKKGESRPSKREDQLAHLNMDLAPASPQPSSSDNPILSRENSLQSSIAGQGPDSLKFLKFAETHRTVLNQILRQSTTPLSDGPFSVLVDHTRILDFDVKRRYFRHELERLDEGIRREDLAVHVRRENVFEDSFRELFRRSADEWKHRFYIVFEGEDGQDAGGLLREWYIIIAREIFNPMYALFATSPGDRVTYLISQSSHCNSNHLSYFKFVGRIIAKAIYDNKLLDCYFTRSFYKHIIGQYVKYTDMESEDYSFYQGLVFLLEHNVKDLGYDLMFSTEIQEFGVNQTRDLVANGRDIFVTEENKHEYVKYVCQMKMTGAIRIQLNAFMEGFYDIIPKNLISIFNEQELELLISGLPVIDIDDLKTNTEYHKYQPTSLQVLWFWRALRSFDQADRARFLQFVTGTSKVPLQGFAHLEGMNGTQKFQIHRDDRSTDRLPAAHTCFNQLDLPAYETYDKLRHMLLLAINECSEGFGLA